MTTPHRSLAALLLLLAAALLATGCGDSGSGSSSKSGGSSSTKASGSDDCDGQAAQKDTIDGIDVVRHCGDASATLTIDGEPNDVTGGGSCQNTDDSVVVNVGSTVVDADAEAEDRAGIDYLGLLAGKHPAANADAPAVDKDGHYSDGVLVSGSIDGTTFALVDDVDLTLSEDRSEGTFSGTTTDDIKVEGSFSC